MSKLILTLGFLSLTLVACQPSKDNSGGGSTPTASGGASAALNDNGPLGPVDNSSQLKYREGTMARADELLSGEWVSQCLSQSIQPHITFVHRLQHYRMIYAFDTENQTVGHFVREYDDPLCEDDFGGGINPNVNESFAVKGFFKVTKQDRTFQNMIRVAYNWTTCAGPCRRYEDPLNGTYLHQTSVAIFRQTDENRQVLFWGQNVPPRMNSYTPFSPEQIFNWNVPFFRIR